MWVDPLHLMLPQVPTLGDPLPQGRFARLLARCIQSLLLRPSCNQFELTHHFSIKAGVTMMLLLLHVGRSPVLVYPVLVLPGRVNVLAVLVVE